jgi:drug/metabolite transporter (DMT)-like permease
VGVAISLQYTAPVLILAATALLARVAPQPLTWAAGLLTLVGAVLVSGALAGSGSPALDTLGVAAGILSALTYAGYLVTAAAAGARGSHPASTLAVGFAVATLLWAVVLPLWSWPFELLADPQVTWRVLAVGLLGTLLPFALTVWALRILSSAVAGIATTTEPLLAALLAWVFLQQALTVPQLIGGALVIAGVLIAQLVCAPRDASVPIEISP